MKAQLTGWRLFALIAGSTLLTSVNFSLVFIAIGEIGKTFKQHPAVVPWALTGFSITTAALMVPAGWMADRFGREWVFIAGLGSFTIGSALVAWSPSVYILLLGRVVQAAGLAMETGSALPILLDAFPADRRATIVGSLGAAGGAAAAMGPVVGGALVDRIGWRSTFFLNVPIGAVLCTLLILRLKRTPPRKVSAPPDLIGVAALALGMGSLVLAITQIKNWGVGDARTLLAGLGAIVLVTVVIKRSQVHPDPVLYLPLFKDPSYRRGVILNILIAGTFAGTFFSYIRLLIDGWGLSTFHAGLAVAVIPLFGGPLSILSGRIADKHGPRVVIVPGAVLIAAAGLVLAAQVTTQRNVGGLFIPIAVLYGIGVGFAHAACHASALRTVTTERLGVGGAMSRIGMDVGGVITVAVAVAFVSSAKDPVAGVKVVTVLVSVVCLLGAALAMRLPPTLAPTDFVSRQASPLAEV